MLSSFKCSLHFHIAYFGIEFSSFHQIIKKQCESVKQSNNDFFWIIYFFFTESYQILLSFLKRKLSQTIKCSVTTQWVILSHTYQPQGENILNRENMEQRREETSEFWILFNTYVNIVIEFWCLSKCKLMHILRQCQK